MSERNWDLDQRVPVGHGKEFVFHVAMGSQLLYQNLAQGCQVL
jgi:hypothetical protein